MTTCQNIYDTILKHYTVLPDGTLYRRGKPIKQPIKPSRNGHFKIACLCIRSRKITVYSHVLVAYTHCSPPRRSITALRKYQVHHKDHDRMNNTSNNLVWMKANEHQKLHRKIDNQKY